MISPARFLFVMLTCLLVVKSSFSQNPQILIIPTIHGNHAQNPNYSYEDLFELIRDFNPDVIGIEIRPEDMEQGHAYLEKLYPKEMRMVRDSFPDIVYGLDFYTQAFENKPVTPEMFRDSTNDLGYFLYLQKKMNQDSSVLNMEIELGIDSLLALQEKMVLQASPEAFLTGKYDNITRTYDSLMQVMLNGTEYERYIEINVNRDQRITANAMELIRENPEKRVLILVGANHRWRLMAAIREEYPIQQKSNDYHENESGQ